MAPKSDQGKESNKKSAVKAEKKILVEVKPVGKKEAAIDKTVQESEPNEAQINFRNPEYYRNRELSWLAFDERCLSEARDRQLVPLFERAKFLSIRNDSGRAAQCNFRENACICERSVQYAEPFSYPVL